MNTKDMIHKYIQTHTQSLSPHDFAVLTTAVIADTLHISRSRASQYLNELFNNGLIIKITSRPVYFLDRVILEKKYHVEHLSKEYLSVKELMEVLREGEFGDIFETVIGHDGSMTQVVQQIKSAVLYPNGGLPLILQGKAGNGKKFLVRTIHQYCLDKGLIEEEQKLYTVKSSSKALSMESVLFGNADVLGILEQKDIAIIYFEQGNYFDKDFQLKIAALINDGYYMKQKKTVKVEKRFIFGVSIEPHEYFEYALLQSIPIISRIPNFDQRGTVEKEAFIFKFFKEEQNHLGHKIKISYKLLLSLLSQVLNLV